MLKNRSVETIDNPEFINITPYNPLISECEIKVLYLGGNRNCSFIDKETAIKMANSLPGTPIVGAWLNEKEDFEDHGHTIIIEEDGEIKFSCKTKPYGFVSPTAKVWFQKFIETDEFGNQIEREYLMTQGYLWTGQFEEAQKAILEGQPQSMELDEESLVGHWATNENSGIEFFIINDALFSKLCILGDDVEPCFEGASVTRPEVSKHFSKDAEFTKTLFTMMNELKNALNTNGEEVNMEEQTDLSESIEDNFTAEDNTEDNSLDMSTGEEETEAVLNQEFTQQISVEENSDVALTETNITLSEKEYTALCEQLEESQSKLQEYEKEIAELREFKLNIEAQEKDALIAKYYMIEDADKADIISNKANYTLDEIEAKLAILYVSKYANFDVTDTSNEETISEESDPIVTFSLDDNTTEMVPAFVEALRKNRH